MAEPTFDGRRGLPIGRVLLAVALVALVVRTVDILLVLFLAVILAIYLDAVTDLLDRRLGMPRPLGLSLGVAGDPGRPGGHGAPHRAAGDRAGPGPAQQPPAVSHQPRCQHQLP